MATPSFIDEVHVFARGGAGGEGMVSFRREKYVSKGGPSGGDGGRGGDLIFVATAGRNTLLHLRYGPHLRADSGARGRSSNKHGACGENLLVEVPVGTVIRDMQGKQVADLAEEGAQFLAVEGGIGGKGNARFATPSRPAPDFSLGAGPAVEVEFRLELKLLADVGLLGFPNAGKSTLISRLSGAKPKVAAYPFTTLTPKLGVVRVPGDYRTFVMADIPGLIEGASEGAGLGLRFLRHVERCRLLLHLVSLDPGEDEMHGDALSRFDKINAELRKFDPGLAERPQVVLLSKADLADDERLQATRDAFEARGLPTLSASAVVGTGLDAVIHAVVAAMDADASASGPAA